MRNDCLKKWGQFTEAPVEPTKYTISFDSGVESITVEEGTVAKEPTTAPEKTGYTFGGWLNGEAAYDWTQPVTSNLSLTAKWTAVEYTITYLPEGVETDNPPTYTIETETIVLDTNPTSPDATKTKFVAWHVDSEEGDVVTEIEKGSTGNKTFYAEFSAEEPCVVKFMSGTTEVASTKVKKGNKITLPTDLEKYNLFYDADCTKAFDTNTAITEDTTIYVKLKTFTISYKVLPFNEEGSLPNIPYGTVFTEEEIDAFAEDIGGYTYKGVFTDEECTVPFDNANAITSDLTVYVLYEEVVEEETLFEVDLSLGTMGWSYNATYDAESKTITLTGNYGQGSTGWNDGANWSAYRSLNVDISEYSNDWGKIVIQDMAGDTIKELEFNTVSEVISMDLTDVDVSAVKQFSIQGKASGDTIVVDRVYFLQIPNVEVEMSLGSMGWSYNATYDVESKTITLTGNYGQGSTGWNDGANWSAYKSLNVDISEYSNDWGKIVIQGMDDAPIKELEFNTVSEVISMDLTDVDVSAVKQFSIQGKASGDTIVVDRVYFITK